MASSTIQEIRKENILITHAILFFIIMKKWDITERERATTCLRHLQNKYHCLNIWRYKNQTIKAHVGQRLRLLLQ